MANEQNLVNFTSEQSREEAAKNGRKGGIASGKAKRERKKFRDTVLAFLEEADENGITNQEHIIEAAIVKAMRGDIRAVEFLRDTIGEKPADELRLEGGVRFTFEGGDDLSG